MKKSIRKTEQTSSLFQIHLLLPDFLTCTLRERIEKPLTSVPAIQSMHCPFFKHLILS
ncbi:hypothetical protein [Legionella pneumophila]|uniref:hypothetical protein n=1 Tax=Legionella pneumophila TaxID=446 RepID=UPI0004B6DB3E|nr:hypothetical protein [Legionella pneumophila]HAT6917533.1 hypothetical protein [Legionella pneumophila]HAT6919972.1 hypothetical protein [Legionella pneumophila]HAT6973443.1 hypothetical protein [Legionella pneumophila]HDU8260575.1 hypothetical protein [Legionella pneumophila]